jgi:hypothetical protein
MRCIWWALPALIPAWLSAEPMSLAFDCHANASESCFVIVTGTIEPDAGARLEAFLDEPEIGVEGFQLLLDSPGGSLPGGMALGRAIRARGWHAVVGRSDPAELENPVAPGECLSACAYAFLGGEGRRLGPGSRLGFHQFALPGGEALPDAVGLAGGQQVSGMVLAYLIEMGVDPRLFVLASATPSAAMVYPSEAELLDYDVVTPRGYSAFLLEPYKNGVVAASRRLDAPRIYDMAGQVTAFCRAGEPRLLMTVPEVPPEPGLEARLVLGAEGRDYLIEPARVGARAGHEEALFDVLLPAEAAQALTEAAVMEFTIDASRVSGGPHWMRRELTAMDRRAITAAFRFCI